MRLFVVGSQCAERSGAPRAHLACCGGAAWGWCLARRTTAGTATPLRTVPWLGLPHRSRREPTCAINGAAPVTFRPYRWGPPGGRGWPRTRLVALGDPTPPLPHSHTHSHTHTHTLTHTSSAVPARSSLSARCRSRRLWREKPPRRECPSCAWRSPC